MTKEIGKVLMPDGTIGRVVLEDLPKEPRDEIHIVSCECVLRDPVTEPSLSILHDRDDVSA